MKTLERLIKKDKTNSVTTKKGELKKRVIEAIKYNVRTNIIHHSSWNISGKHSNLVTYRDQLIDVLSILGYKYTEGNDAPRGGKEGDYISVSITALSALKSLIS